MDEVSNDRKSIVFFLFLFLAILACMELEIILFYLDHHTAMYGVSYDTQIFSFILFKY